MFENLSIRVRVRVKVRLLHETDLGLAPRDRLQLASRDWLRACSARLTAIYVTRLA
jgi:hypothetical protein